jgi:hypothetical protein
MRSSLVPVEKRNKENKKNRRMRISLRKSKEIIACVKGNVKLCKMNKIK